MDARRYYGTEYLALLRTVSTVDVGVGPTEPTLAQKFSHTSSGTERYDCRAKLKRLSAEYPRPG